VACQPLPCTITGHIPTFWLRANLSSIWQFSLSWRSQARSDVKFLTRGCTTSVNLSQTGRINDAATREAGAASNITV
jgi:hypothetical protein